MTGKGLQQNEIKLQYFFIQTAQAVINVKELSTRLFGRQMSVVTKGKPEMLSGFGLFFWATRLKAERSIRVIQLLSCPYLNSRSNNTGVLVMWCNSYSCIDVTQRGLDADKRQSNNFFFVQECL